MYLLSTFCSPLVYFEYHPSFAQVWELNIVEVQKMVFEEIFRFHHYTQQFYRATWFLSVEVVEPVLD